MSQEEPLKEEVKELLVIEVKEEVKEEVIVKEEVKEEINTEAYNRLRKVFDFSNFKG